MTKRPPHPIPQLARWLLALALGVNALFMLGAPRLWFDTLPGVPFTGPFNHHFVQDIGCAYLVCALGLAWRARMRMAWPAGVLSALFLLMHGCVHLLDLAQGRCTAAGFVRDAPAVIAPALVALWLAAPPWPWPLSSLFKTGKLHGGTAS